MKNSINIHRIMPYFTFKGIGGDCKNSKNFSRYREKPKRNSLILGPIFTPKMAILGVLLCNKILNLWLFILKVTKQSQGMITQQNTVVWSISMAVYP